MKHLKIGMFGLAAAATVGVMSIPFAPADEVPTTMPSTRPSVIYSRPPSTQPVISAGQPASTQPVLVGGPTISNSYPVPAPGPGPNGQLHGVATDPGATPVTPANIQQNTGVGVGIGDIGPNMAGPTTPTNAPAPGTGSVNGPTTVPSAVPIRR